MNQEAQELLTIEDAALLIDLSPATVRTGIAEGNLTPEEHDGVTFLPRRELIRWKRIRAKDVLDRDDVKAARITDADLLQAKLQGAVCPSAPPDPRYSYEDIVHLVAWNGIAPPAACRPRTPLREAGTAREIELEELRGTTCGR